MAKEKKSKVFLIISAIILMIVGFFVINSYVVNTRHKEGIKNAIIDWTKLELKMFYESKGKYPDNFNDLIKHFKENRDSVISDPDFNAIVKLLDEIDNQNNSGNNPFKKFDYKVRGDGQVAKISYTDFNNHKQTIEFNYKNDFN